MKFSTLLLTLLSMTSAASVDAQQLYKSVGPDGKVTFSDQKPGGHGKISVLRSNVLRPLEEPATPNAVALPPTIKLPKSPGAERAAAPAYARAPSTPELEEAVTAVLLLQEVSKKFELVCSPTPQAAGAYGAAVGNWRKRNASFIEAQTRILMEVIDPVKRASIQQKVDTRVSAALAEVVSLQPAWRVKWCDRAISEMGNGSNDIAKNVAVAVPLITYKFH